MELSGRGNGCPSNWSAWILGDSLDLSVRSGWQEVAPSLNPGLSAPELTPSAHGESWVFQGQLCLVPCRGFGKLSRSPRSQFLHLWDEDFSEGDGLTNDYYCLSPRGIRFGQTVPASIFLLLIHSLLTPFHFLNVHHLISMSSDFSEWPLNYSHGILSFLSQQLEISSSLIPPPFPLF